MKSAEDLVNQFPIIAICGFKRSGKSTMANEFMRAGYHCLSFAGPLKRGLKSIYGFSDEQLYGKLKEVKDPFWGVTPRHIMQKFGTELMREVAPQITDVPYRASHWIMLMEKNIRETKGPVVVDDLRFQDEAKFLQSLGAIIIKIDDGTPITPEVLKRHPSEVGFLNIQETHIFHKSQGILAMRKFVSNICSNHL
jgi:hypothetical protein